MKKRLPRLKETFTNQWLYKVVALVVALSIWFTTLENKKDVMRSKMVQVKFAVGAHRRLESSQSGEVQVVVVGPKSLVQRYIQTVSYITLDLAGAEAGMKRIDFNAADLGLPAGVRLYRVDPQNLELSIKEVQ